MNVQQLFLICSGLLGFLGVAAGAFGAHFLKTRLTPELLGVYEVAVRYQLFHVAGLLCLAALVGLFPSIWLISAGWLFLFGTLIFSGSLYVLVLTEVKAWGAITPIGGVILLIGWLCILIGGVIGRS